MFGRALHVIEEGGEFRFNSIPVSIPKNEYVAVSILSIGARIDLYVYYVVVGFSDRCARRVSKFWSADLLLVRNRSNILSPLVGLSMTCSILWWSEMQ